MDEVWKKPCLGTDELSLRPLCPDKEAHSCTIQPTTVNVRVGKLARWSLLVSLKLKTTHIVIKRTPLCTDQLHTCQSHAELQQM